MIKTIEKDVFKINGFIALFPWIFVLLFLLAGAFIRRDPYAFAPLIVYFVFSSIFIFPGFYIIQPNESRVLVFFGNYIGTNKDAGFWWSNPFATKSVISLKIRNLESSKLKVNDSHGSPIEIGIVMVWKVINSASALLDVESYQHFVQIQCETAIRSICSLYPYDLPEDGENLSLRGNSLEISDNLKKELQSRLMQSGIIVLEARISYLAYAPEIAQAMLRRQQAEAIISARQKIVEGAVGMVEMALNHLSENKIVNLDDDKKALMVNNLLVALVSESEAQPVINTGIS